MPDSTVRLSFIDIFIFAFTRATPNKQTVSDHWIPNRMCLMNGSKSCKQNTAMHIEQKLNIYFKSEKKDSRNPLSFTPYQKTSKTKINDLSIFKWFKFQWLFINSSLNSLLMSSQCEGSNITHFWGFVIKKTRNQMMYAYPMLDVWVQFNTSESQMFSVV